MTPAPSPIICLVTGGHLGDGSHADVEAASATAESLIRDAVAGGIDVVQIREPRLDTLRLLTFVRRVLAAVRPAGARVLVNDRVDVALAAGADGVHLRADGPPIARVRAIGPAGWIVGRSIHSAAEAVTHAAADYLLFGTVFRSTSKPADAPVQGLEALHAATAAVSTPVWAIGGIDEQRVPVVLRAGATGVAAIGAFAGDTGARVRAMRRAVAGVFDNLLE